MKQKVCLNCGKETEKNIDFCSRKCIEKWAKSLRRGRGETEYE